MHVGILIVASAQATEPDPYAARSASKPELSLEAALSEASPLESSGRLSRATERCASSPRLSLHRGALVGTSELYAAPEMDPWPLLTPSASNAAWSRVSSALAAGLLPSPGSARPEELVSALPVDDLPPARGEILAVRAESAQSPWDRDASLVRVSVTARSPRPLQRGPVALALVVDANVGDIDSLRSLSASLDEIVRALSPNDVLSIVDGEGVLLPPGAVGDGSAPLSALSALRSGEGNLPRALVQGYNLLKDAPEGVRRVLLLSDGELSLIERGDELEMLASGMALQGVGLHGIGYGSRFGRDEGVESLARASGGSYLHVGDPDAARRLLDAHLSALIEPVVGDLQLLVEWDPSVRGVHRSGYHHDRLSGFSSSPAGRDLGAGQTISVLYEVRAAPGASLGTVRVRALPFGLEEPVRYSAALLKPSVPLSESSPDLVLGFAAARLGEMLGRERPTERAGELLVFAESAARPERIEDAELVQMLRVALPLLRAPRCW